jgi:hypothetical protein
MSLNMKMKDPAEAVKVHSPDTYLQAIQYNWTGKYDEHGKKIPGKDPVCFAKVLYPKGKEPSHADPFSIMHFRVVAGTHLNSVRFKTICNIVYVESGTGTLRVYDEMGKALIAEHSLAPQYTIHIQAMTRYSWTASQSSDLNLVIFSTPAWFKEDEEFYDWELSKMIPGATPTIVQLGLK